MLDQPRAALASLLAPGSRLGRPSLHAGLHRLCHRHVQRLRNLLREPAWETRAVEIEQRLGFALEHPDWSLHMGGHPRWGDDDHILVFSAALLRALDTYHKHHRREMEAPVVDVPSWLGGGKTLFLPPAPAPIESLVPDSRKLRRGQRDLRSDIHEILELWWRLLPLEERPIQPRLLILPCPVSEMLGLRLQEGDLRIGVCSPFVGFEYIVRIDPARSHPTLGVPYRFAEMAPASLDQARKLLADVVDACAREKVDILCFPELTLDTSLLRELSVLLKLRNDTLHPALVMAGSFHMDAGLSRANRCSLLDGFGNLLLLAQDKCTPYSMPGHQVVRLRPELRAMLGLDERGGYEDIELSPTLNLVESSLGRLATPICLDFCGDQLRDLIVDTQVNFLLVPAMTPRMGPFYIRARELGTLTRATTLAVNSAWLLHQLGLRSRRQRAFLYLPTRKGLKGGGRRISDELSVFTIREVLGLP